MTGLWRHPNGSYYFRRAVPPELRSCVEAGKPRHEYKRSLRTKDLREAKQRYPDAAKECDAYLNRLRALKEAAETSSTSAAAPSPAPSQYSPDDLPAFAAEIARRMVAEYENNPAPVDIAFKGKSSVPPGGDWGNRDEPWAARRWMIARSVEGWFPATADSFVAGRVDAFAKENGLTFNATDWRNLCELARPALDDALETLQRFARGDKASARPFHDRYPASAPAARPAKRPSVTITGLVKVWAKGVERPNKRTYDQIASRLAHFSAFLGHDDATAVTINDIYRWRDALRDKGNSAKTIDDDTLSRVRTAFRAAIATRVLTANPFADYVPLRRAKKGKGRSRHPYSDEQAAQVLAAARKETGALRWLPWIMAYTGARIGEASQLRKEDISPDGSIPFLKIADDEADQSLKTEASYRELPIHRALAKEGFLKFVAAAPAGPLFSDLRVSKHGTRSDAATDKYMHWLRNVVGIKDKLIVSHSWRHRVETQLSELEIPIDVAHAITGRANAGSRATYLHGISLKVKAKWIEKLPEVKASGRPMSK